MEKNRTISRATATCLVLALAAAIAVPNVEAQVVNLYDRWGGYVGSTAPVVTKPGARVVTTSRPMSVVYGDRTRDLAAGVYFAFPAPGPPASPSPAAPGSFGFEDVSAEFLPAGEWDARDVQSADFNGDGLEDIVFTLNRTFCDSAVDKRPRLLIRGADGRYIDETESRIPVGRYAADQAVVIDVDGDLDSDLFLTGYGCLDSDPGATLLINDGAGAFTDQSASRLPAPDLIFSAAAGTLDSNDSPDLLVVEWRLDTLLAIRPAVWLNDGDGTFSRDTAGRFVADDYGYLVPAAADVNGDQRPDVLFANLGLCVTTPSGPECVDTLFGGSAVYVNQGDGFLVDETATRFPPLDTLDFRNVEPVDADDDGDIDLLLVSLFDQPLIRLLVNDGAGEFHQAGGMATDTLAGIVLDAAAGNLDGDRYPDLYLTRVYFGGMPGKDALLVNTGAGGWTDSSSLLPDSLDFSYSAALIDHDDDNDPDVLTSNLTDIRLYRNLLNDATAVGGPTGETPSAFRLLANYPNPFNPSTTIRYSVPSAGRVRLSVYNVLGEEVRQLVDEDQHPGWKSVIFDAEGLPSGVYTLRIVAGGFTGVGKMVLVQ